MQNRGWTDGTNNKVVDCNLLNTAANGFGAASFGCFGTGAETEPAEPQAQAEIRPIGAIETDWILLAGPGAILHSQALGRIAFAHVRGDAPAFIFDSETGCPDGGRVRRSDPVVRQVVHYDTLLESNMLMSPAPSRDHGTR